MNVTPGRIVLLNGASSSGKFCARECAIEVEQIVAARRRPGAFDRLVARRSPR